VRKRLLAVGFWVLGLSAAQVIEVPYVPTELDVAEAMLKLADVKPGDVVYDLGCGDGRIVILAAQKFGTRGLGVDLDPKLVAEASAAAAKAGVADKARFRRQDVFETPVGEASVVTLYMTADVNRALRPRLVRELKTGSRIVSHFFDMDDWKPDRTITIRSVPLHLWVVTEQAKARYAEK
jgi:SAM-dependent methyltransferase